MAAIAFNGSYSSPIRSEIFSPVSIICRSAATTISSVVLSVLYQMIPPASATTMRSCSAVMPR